MARKAPLILLWFCFALLVVGVWGGLVVPFQRGAERARNDLDFRSREFGPGEGYLPSSTFTNGEAQLYRGFPVEAFVEGAFIPPLYESRWIAGYEKVVRAAGYRLTRTDAFPEPYGNVSSR